MAIHFSWFVPTNGDGEYIGLARPEREATLDYLGKVAQAAEAAGFSGILIPVGAPFLDSWMVASAICQCTSKISPLVAFRPGFVAPTLAAKMAATLDQFSGGRLWVNVVTGGSPSEQGQDGDFLEHDRRYQRTDEFLTIVRKLWQESSVSFEGEFFSVRNAALYPSNYQRRQLPVYFGGSSEAAKEVAAKHADVYLQWGEPVEEVRRQINDVKRRAAAYSRQLEFGVRIHVIVREGEEEAWAAANRLISRIDPVVEQRMQDYYRRADSVAQQRMSQLLEGAMRFGKHKWAGIGRVRKGAGTAVVGTPEQVKEGLMEYVDAGVNHFILSGFPHLEEAERVGNLVLPLFSDDRAGVLYS
ncbi:LLM class flavin-dependent oxidoreductase [Brevibacillus massiliensis]|uniref:LLM class flavin-dependent oxidoreductase n=1 Tax=Brevibacillus massiliensis TaxID=1118054 RepID=UPI00031A46A9|nr:LLM class flavin-dependent oxidoreductase [Brevibacillus massiliensis]